MNLWEKYKLDPNTGNPPMAMDLRHVDMLYHEILKAKPRVAVEIGSHKGHSAVAFLEAMHVLPEMELHLFDPKITKELEELVKPFEARVHLHAEAVWNSPLRPDFVFIDGHHGVPALADLGWCLAREAPIIAMHDTFTANRLPECHGAMTAANLLEDMPDRTWWEDAKDRPGENTWRGFGISIKNP